MGGTQIDGSTNTCANAVALGRFAYCSTLLQGDHSSSPGSPKRLPNTATPAAHLGIVNPHTHQLVTHLESEAERCHRKLL